MCWGRMETGWKRGVSNGDRADEKGGWPTSALIDLRGLELSHAATQIYRLPVFFCSLSSSLAYVLKDQSTQLNKSPAFACVLSVWSLASSRLRIFFQRPCYLFPLSINYSRRWVRDGSVKVLEKLNDGGN